MSSPHPEPSATSPERYLWLSLAAAVTTIALKVTAALITDSVGLLSDALESFVNLAGAGFALWMLIVSRRPPDAEHPFGHGKAEYFSSGFEGLLIFGAAIAIGWSAVLRLVSPAPLASLDLGLALATAASLVNLFVARTLSRAATRHRSVALDADARHLMTDVWTSIGVVLGVLAVALTDVLWLDPVIAIAVALNIAREGFRLVRQSTDGLLDRSLPDDELAAVQQTLSRFASPVVHIDGVRTRRAGHAAFMTAIVTVPGDWSVARAHDLADEIEAALRQSLPHLTPVLHIEPASRHV